MKNTTAKATRVRKHINMEKVDKNLKEQIENGATASTIKTPAIEDMTEENENSMTNVQTLSENEEKEINDFRDLVDEVVDETDHKKIKKIEWWNGLPRKERFKTGDIVYDTSTDHFGIFVEPAKKEGLIKLRLFKLGTKHDVYTRDWYLEFDNIQLVKRGVNIKRGFIENENMFLIKSRRKYNVKVKEGVE
jgi:hypothetical protein